MSRAPILGVLAATLGTMLVSPAARAQDAFGGGASAEAESPPESSPAPPPTSPSRAPLALRFDGAYAVRRLFRLGVTGTDLGVAFGSQTSHHFAVWWANRLTLGSTDNGLSVWSLRSGVEIEGVYDPVRIGIGAGIMVIDVGRARRDDDVSAWGLEGRAFARLDAWRTDSFALFVRAALDGGIETSTGSAFWGPGIGVGLELGVSGKRRPEWTATR